MPRGPLITIRRGAVRNPLDTMPNSLVSFVGCAALVVIFELVAIIGLVAAVVWAWHLML